MKAIVFSDSHGKMDAMIDIIAKNNDIDKIIHLGDLVRDAEMLQNEYPNYEMIYGAGNNDWSSNEPKECLAELEGKRFFITHGNSYGVKNGISKIIQRAKQLEAEVVLFGHTHIPYECYVDNILLLNPGSITLPACGSRRSYCIIDLTPKGIKTNFLQL